MLSSAYSSELPRYGLKVGLKNYGAAYATGLLVARRTLTKLGMAEQYPGNDAAGCVVVKTTHTNAASATREYWVKEVAEDRKPFRCVLDVGIAATTTGARVFGVLKGAADGGLDIPHNEKRFPGYNRDNKKCVVLSRRLRGSRRRRRRCRRPCLAARCRIRRLTLASPTPRPVSP